MYVDTMYNNNTEINLHIKVRNQVKE